MIQIAAIDGAFEHVTDDVSRRVCSNPGTPSMADLREAKRVMFKALREDRFDPSIPPAVFAKREAAATAYGDCFATAVLLATFPERAEVYRRECAEALRLFWSV